MLPLASLLNRIGNIAAQRRWLVIGAWVLAIVLAATAVKAIGANTSNNRVPKWADRFLPHLDIEGEGAAAEKRKSPDGSMKL